MTESKVVPIAGSTTFSDLWLEKTLIDFSNEYTFAYSNLGLQYPAIDD